MTCYIIENLETNSGHRSYHIGGNVWISDINMAYKYYTKIKAVKIIEDRIEKGKTMGINCNRYSVIEVIGTKKDEEKYRELLENEAEMVEIDSRRNW